MLKLASREQKTQLDFTLGDKFLQMMKAGPFTEGSELLNALGPAMQPVDYADLEGYKQSALELYPEDQPVMIKEPGKKPRFAPRELTEQDKNRASTLASSWLEAEHKRQGETLPLQPGIREAEKQDLGDKIKGILTSPFTATPKDKRAKAMNIYAVSKTLDLPINTVRKNYEDFSRQLGMRTTPTTPEMFGGLIMFPIAAGALANPVGVAFGLAGFEALSEIESAIISRIKGEPYQILAHKNLNDLLPEEASRLTRDAVEVFDFLGKGLILGGIYRKSPKIAEKFTRDIVENYKLPQKFYISPEKVSSIFRTGEKISLEEMDLVKSLNLKSSEYRQAVKKGIEISIPAERITTITDKPYWAKVKKLFRVKPGEPKVSVETLGEQEVGFPPARLPETAGPDAAGGQATTFPEMTGRSRPFTVEESWYRQMVEKDQRDAQIAGQIEAQRAVQKGEGVPPDQTMKPGQIAAQPPEGARAEGELPEPLEQIEIKVEGEPVILEPRYSVGGRGWEGTPSDNQIAWGDMMGDVERVEQEARPQVEQLETELKSMKGQRNKEAMEVRKGIKAQITRLKAQYENLDAVYQEYFRSYYNDLETEALEKAKAAGVPEDRFEYFIEEFMMEISDERPYIEYNAEKTIREVFDEVVPFHIPNETAFRKLETEIHNAKNKLKKDPDNQPLKNQLKDLQDELEFHRQAAGEGKVSAMAGEEARKAQEQAEPTEAEKKMAAAMEKEARERESRETPADKDDRIAREGLEQRQKAGKKMPWQMTSQEYAQVIEAGEFDEIYKQSWDYERSQEAAKAVEELKAKAGEKPTKKALEEIKKHDFDLNYHSRERFVSSKINHYTQVWNAYGRGEKVPDSVLEEYPQLKEAKPDGEGNLIYTVRGRPVKVSMGISGGEDALIVEPGHFPISHTGYRSMSTGVRYTGGEHGGVTPEDLEAQAVERQKEINKAKKIPKKKPQYISGLDAETTLREAWTAPDEDIPALLQSAKKKFEWAAEKEGKTESRYDLAVEAIEKAEKGDWKPLIDWAYKGKGPKSDVWPEGQPIRINATGPGLEFAEGRFIEGKWPPKREAVKKPRITKEPGKKPVIEKGESEPLQEGTVEEFRAATDRVKILNSDTPESADEVVQALYALFTVDGKRYAIHREKSDVLEMSPEENEADLYRVMFEDFKTEKHNEIRRNKAIERFGKSTLEFRLFAQLTYRQEDVLRKWEKEGVTDQEIKEMIGEKWGIMKGGTDYEIHGGKNPRFEYKPRSKESVLLKGKKLIDKIREVMNIPQPGKAKAKIVKEPGKKPVIVKPEPEPEEQPTGLKVGDRVTLPNKAMGPATVVKIFENDLGKRVRVKKDKADEFGNTDWTGSIDRVTKLEPEPKAKITKQPWEMTLLEFAKSRAPKDIARMINNADQAKSYSAQHGVEIKAALERGDPVPQSILDDYPVLAERYGEKAKVEITGKGKDKTVDVEGLSRKEEAALSPKEQKEYLFDEIDAAIEKSKDAKDESLYAAGGKKLQKGPGYTQDNRKKYGAVIIEVPGDGKFTVLNTKQSLEVFKKAMGKFPATGQWTKPTFGAKPIKVPGPSQKRTGGEVEYYNPFRPRKKTTFIENEEKGNVYAEGFFSDGSYLIKVDKQPKVKKYQKADSGLAKQIKGMIEFGKKAIPAELVGEFNTGTGEEPPLIHLATENDEHYLFNPKYIDHILTLHPKAKPFTIPQGTEGPLMPGATYFKVGNKVVGLAMPRKAEQYTSDMPEGSIVDLPWIVREGYAEQTEKPMQLSEMEEFAQTGRWYVDEEGEGKLRVYRDDELVAYTERMVGIYGGRGYKQPITFTENKFQSFGEIRTKAYDLVKKHIEQTKGKQEDKPVTIPDNLKPLADQVNDYKSGDLYWNEFRTVVRKADMPDAYQQLEAAGFEDPEVFWKAVRGQKFKEMNREIQERTEQAVKENLEAAGDSEAVRLEPTQQDDIDRGVYYIVSRDTAAKDDYKWRATRFDKDGPSGHNVFKSRDNAITSLSGKSVDGPKLEAAGDYKVVKEQPRHEEVEKPEGYDDDVKLGDRVIFQPIKAGLDKVTGILQDYVQSGTGTKGWLIRQDDGLVYRAWEDQGYINKPAGAKKEPSKKIPTGTGESVHDAERRGLLKKYEDKRYKTAGDETAIFRLKGELEADPSKWSVGDGVGYYAGGATATKRGSQINRGFRITKIQPENKVAGISQVADTGLTVTGGDRDKIEDQWVHIADLVRDRKYDAPAGAGVPSGTADTGGYADIGGYEAPEQEAGPGPVAMELPEIVELARQLLAGKLPKVKRRLRGPLGIRGRFRHVGKKGDIEVLAGLFTNLNEATKVVAHEIGHLIDWLPDKDIKRGNILGRIASLKKYMKHFLESRPGAKGPLTDEDRVRLKGEARKLAKAEREELIDEEIRKELPIKPEDVLAIWNSATFDIRQNEELYRYIQELSSVEKKSIVKEALKGNVPRRLQQFSKVVYEKTGRKIKRGPSAASIEQKYKDLIRQEIEKRKLFQRDEIMNELIDFTHAWKPFDATANSRYTKYRYSSVELYADALSALITNPAYLRDNAPKFYEGFFNYLDRKPEVKDLFERIQNQIKSGTAQQSLVIRTREGFGKREDEYRELLKRRSSDWLSKEAWGAFFIDKYFGILSRVKKVGESNIPADFNPRYKLEELEHAATEAEGYLVDLERGVLEPLRNAGLDAVDLGEYLFHKRVSTERSELANPLGWTPDRSNKRIEEMDVTLGSILEDTRAAFQKLRGEWFKKRVAEANMYAPELAEKILTSSNYATFDIVGHLEQKYGRTATGHIYRQVGTFTETGNPLTATVIKDLSIMRAVNKNIAVKSVVDFFNGHFPNEIQEADTRWNGRYHDLQESGDPDMKLVVYMEEGKAKGFYLPKYVAESLRQNPVESLVIAKLLRVTAAPFRSLFTEFNPGFWIVNIVRDFQAAVKQLEGLTWTKFFPIWIKALPPAFKSTLGHPDETVRDMLKQKMLISVADYHHKDTDDLELERLLKRYNIQPSVWDHKVLKPFNSLIRVVKGISRGFERAPKIAGYRYLKEKYPEMPDQVLAHIVRTRAGSPDFMRQGMGAPIYNNLLLFSNAMKEGYRSTWEATTANPAEFAWKSAKYSILPKLLMYAGAVGLLGEATRRILKRASSYDKANYTCIPLGETPNGKGVYLRVPQDEFGRVVGGIWWKLQEKELPNLHTSLIDYMAGQVPTLTPWMSVLLTTTEYFSGKNPYDHFRGRYLIDEEVFTAGGKRSHKEFSRWVSNQLGGGIVYRFGYDGVEPVKTELEEVLGYPLVSNIVGRFVKISDYGLREELREDTEKLQRYAARDRLAMKDAIAKMVTGEKGELTTEEIIALANNVDNLEYHFQKAMAARYGNVYMQRLITAQTKEERLLIIARMVAENFQKPKVIQAKTSSFTR